MPKQLLTQTFVDAVQCPRSHNKLDYRDTKRSGLTLKVLRSGKKSYYIVFRSSDGRRVEKRFADAAVMPLNSARSQAQTLLAQFAVGKDPFEQPTEPIQESQQASVEPSLTFAAFVSEYYLPHAKSYKRSWSTDVSLLNNHLLPLLGPKRLNAIKKQDLIHLFARHRRQHKPSSTNRVIILCRYIFNCALKWDIEGFTSNPTHGIDLFPANNKRERYLNEDEAQRLFKSLENSKNLQLKNIVAMLLLTGARKSEVLNAQWEDFDLAKRIWTIEFNKTGQVRYIPISDGVLQLLESMPRFDDCPYVFANPKTKQPYVHLFPAWNQARKRAGLPDVRIHDLRHSFASFLINSGRSLYEVQKILGHTQTKTTQRYAHLSQDSLISAANSAMKSVPVSALMPRRPLQVPLVSTH